MAGLIDKTPARLFRRLFFTTHTRREAWTLIADLTHAGLALSDALETAADVAQAQGKTQVRDVLLDIRAGIPRDEFIDRIAFYVDGPEQLLFATVDEADAGSLFQSAAKLAEINDKIRSAILGAIAMPVVMLFGLGALLFMLGTQLYPALADVVPAAAWPAPARAVSGVAEWFAGHVPLVMTLIIAAVIGAGVLLRFWTGAGRRYADILPPFSIYKMQSGIGFIFTVVELGKMGVTINSALLDDIAVFGTPYLRSRIREISRQFRTKKFGQATIDAGQDFPMKEANAVLRALDGQNEWVGKFSAYLDRRIARYVEQVSAQAKALNVILLVFIASTLATTMGSTFSIVQSIR